MLAQNLKTPADLGITDAEFDALAKVLGMLERGELTHTDKRAPTVPNGFNMGVVKTKTDCGTVCCIYGWACTLCDWHTSISHDLFTVFCPPNIGKYSAITPAQAAIALRSYLTHGDPRWDEALAS